MPTFLDKDRRKKLTEEYSSLNPSSLPTGTEIYIIIWLTFAILILNVIFGLGKNYSRKKIF